MIERRDLIGAGLAAATLPLTARVRAQAQVPGPIINKVALVESRLLMAAKVGGQGPFFFAIDTGGDLSLIDHAFAQRLRMKPVDGRPLIGIGGLHEESWYESADVTLASGVRLPRMLFVGKRGGMGNEVVGSFGVGLITTFDCDLDFAKGEWRGWVHGRPDRTGWTKLASRFTGRGDRPSRIEVDASIDSYSGNFLLDTGSPGSVMLDGPAAKASGLWSADRPYAPARVSGIGRGRPMRRIVRAGRLKVGKFVFERPLVSLSPPGTGENFDFDGLIGLSTLSRLNLSTDVKASSLWVQPSGVEPVFTEPYSRSGLWLDQGDGGIVVRDVGFGSPAAEAGVKAGDTVAGSFVEALRAIGGPAGKPVTLKVARAGAVRTVNLTLADYL